MMNTNSTLVIVPTYNERENVSGLVEQIMKYAPEADVMLVDDNSPDGTADLAVELFGADARFSVMRREGARGYGRSVIDGLRHGLDAGYARVVQMDADFSHDPASIPALLAASRKADVVIGSRYCEGGGIGNWPLRRKLLSRFANRYVATITGMHVSDATSGFRCFNRRALEYLLQGQSSPKGTPSSSKPSTASTRPACSVAEVPILFVDRREGQSKISRKVILESVLMPWRLRFSRYTPNDQQRLMSQQDG